MICEILLLGNPALYEVSELLQESEANQLQPVANDLHDTLMDFRRKYGAGRAIAAPQIGVRKRMVYMHTGAPIVFLNPVIVFEDNEEMTLLDDCMSHPDLFVKVRRHRRCKIVYKDMAWRDCSMSLSGDLSELLQHEADHLDGILSPMRAVDDRSFYTRESKALFYEVEKQDILASADLSRHELPE